jgi:hypothetical protein
VEELNDVNVGRVGAELFLQDDIDAGLEEESVVDRDETNSRLTVPAGLTAPGDGAIHKVITDQEESLKQFSHPAQCGEILVLLLRQRLLQQRNTGIGDGETAVELSAGNVGVEVL